MQDWSSATATCEKVRCFWLLSLPTSDISRPDTMTATLYATVSASYTIEQAGLPRLTQEQDEGGRIVEMWNGDSPHRRLNKLQDRLAQKDTK